MKTCAEAAGRVLDDLDQASRPLVVTGCFDEIFFHGKPVLVGVEPQSMAWVLGEQAADRSGWTWTQALEGFEALEHAVVDGGRGLHRGLVDLEKRRQSAAVGAEGRDAKQDPSVADAAGRGRWLAAALVQTEYCRQLAADWEESYRRVAAVLRHTVRASSAVECMNSVLRMHQGRHRTVTQPMLDLKRLYWNCRPFQSGKRRGRCPYELLGLNLPTTDWWELLHAALSDSTQELSTSEVAI